MAGLRLSDKVVRGLPTSATGAKITYDADVPGFGVRVTAAGFRAFILTYRTRSGRERRYTIGSYPAWSTGSARKYAAELKAQIRLGHDPLGALKAERTQPTVSDLCDRYLAENLGALRPKSQLLYRSAIDGTSRCKGIRAHFGNVPVADLRRADVAAYHRLVTAVAPTTANRFLAVLARMLSLAVSWEWRADSPAKGVAPNHEVKRERYLSQDEIARLSAALASCADRQATDIVRLLLLTGARSGETMAARWVDFDLQAGVWIKPASTTKTRKLHRVPLSEAAVTVLAAIPRTSVFVFPADTASGHRLSIKSAWPSLCRAAGLADLRPHDLRHSFASILINGGLGLPIIGRLLGHADLRSTQRYAHLADDPLRAATERVGTIIEQATNVIPIGGTRG